MEFHLPELDNVFLGPLQKLYRACILVVLFAQLKDKIYNYREKNHYGLFD
jgi:hypothetical protein